MAGLFGNSQGAVQGDAPTVSGMRVQTATRGKAVPLLYGMPRIAPNLIWYGNFKVIPQVSQQYVGGKGGGGGGGQGAVSYSYTAAVMLALCEGAINGIPRVWRGKEVFQNSMVGPQQVAKQGEVVRMGLGDGSGFVSGSINAAPGSGPVVTKVSAALGDGNTDPANFSVYVVNIDFTQSGSTVTVPDMWAGWQLSVDYTYTAPGYYSYATDQAGLAVYAGTYAQNPWPWLATYAPDQALAYRGLAYVAAADYLLDDSGSLLNHSFEVLTQSAFSGDIPDANPRDIVMDFLSSPTYGVGLPATRLGDWSQFSNYCVANGIFLSPAYETKAKAAEMLNQIVQICNSEVVYSEGVIKIVPRGDLHATGNGANYVPNLTPLYDLTDDDFLGDSGEDPIQMTRKAAADAYNIVKIKYPSRSNNYNDEVAEAKDQNDIEIFGPRELQQMDCPEICSDATARAVAQIHLQRQLYVRNTYAFRLGWRYCLLEPMDLVTITDPALGLDRALVRILTVEEDETGELAITAEEMPLDIANAARYPTQAAGGYSHNYNVAAGNASAVAIFEPPGELSGGLEIVIAAAGLANYGGCNIWVSFDGDTYKEIGSINGVSRMGVLSAPLAAGAAVDTVNTLSVDFSGSGGTLISGTEDDARNFRTLLWVGDELVSYATATLTGANRYDLTYLGRGGYSSPAAGHPAGTQVVRLDDATVAFPFQAADIGRTVYVKIQAFNGFKGGLQELADLVPYQHVITGQAYNLPLPDVKNLATNFVAGITQIYCDTVDDYRAPIDYEFRLGASWAAGVLVARTPLAQIAAVGDGTYWVAAHYRSPGGVDAYSKNPASIVIAGAVLTRNVVARYDDAAAGWPGTVSEAANKSGGYIILAGAGDVLGVDNILALPDVLWYGGVAPEGIYSIPAAERVNVGRVAACNVLMTWAGQAQSIYDNLLALGDLLAVSDMLSAALNTKIVLRPQIRTAQADGAYGDWQSYVPGTYSAQYFDARMVIQTTDPQVIPYLSKFVFTVDVPDRVEKGTNVAVPAAGAAIAYATAFNVNPNVQVTILNAQAGDDVQLTGDSAGGFTVKVLNGGVGVARNINWVAQAY